MAKKKEEGLKYLQMPLPQPRESYKSVKINWSGLNLRNELDTGNLSMERNISTKEAPYLTPSPMPKPLSHLLEYVDGLSMYGFDNYLVAVYSENYEIYAMYIETIGNSYGDCFLCRLNPNAVTVNDAYDRNIVQFNVYDSPTDVTDGEYVKRLLVFPDKVSMPIMSDIVKINGGYPNNRPQTPDIKKVYCFTNWSRSINEYTYYVYDGTNWAQSGGTGYFVPKNMAVLVKEYNNGDSPYPPDSASHKYYWKNTATNDIYKWVDDDSDSGNSGWKTSVPPNMPPIKYATVHLSRLFGVDNDRVYASGFNDYTNWNLDTVDEYNESNAWVSPAQANTKADGNFTGITTFENHVICFKRDFMHEIYNTKNPFRIQDIFEEGTIDNRTIQNVDGKLIFVSADGVKIYTGGNPRIISLNLDIDEYEYAVSGTDGRNYYLYCENQVGETDTIRRMLTYDTYVGQWSEQSIIDARVKNFATTKQGTYILLESTFGAQSIYKIDSGSYIGSLHWAFETDLMTRQGKTPTVNIKHIKKIQLLADIKEAAYIKIYALYDGEKFNSATSQLLYDSGTDSKDRTIPIRIKPRKSAHYSLKLHFEGIRYVKIYEMELFFEQGGDLYG